VLVIVEGPDCAGKSTLVERLAKRIGNTTTFHKGPPTRHPVIEYAEDLLDYRPGTGLNIICDRWHWGERVYPEVLDRSSQLDLAAWRWIEMFLRSRGALVVRLDPDLQLLKTRLAERGDDTVAEEMLHGIVCGYRKTAYASMLPIATCYPDESFIDTQLDQIIDRAREHENSTHHLNLLHTYVGPPRPDFLLVGDVRVTAYRQTKWPAFGPLPATSGRFLLNALSGPRVPRFGIINANDVDDIGKAHALLNYTPAVIALGINAHETLAGHGIRHGAVPHPQYVRRFHHMYAEQYGALINDTLLTREDNLKWRP
jgi:deoxyadenosine/deoxycytidine kinase